MQVLLEQIKQPGLCDSLRAAMHSKFAVYLFEIPFYRAFSYNERISDLLVRATCCQEVQDLYLAYG